MGTAHAETTQSALATALFTPVQQRVLALLFGQPSRRFQSAEIIRLVDAGTGAPHRVLQRLAQAGLVDVATEGNQKYYQANPACAIFDELVGIVRKTVGLVQPIRDALEPLAPDIRFAFVFGSVAKGTDDANSDVDLMVVGNELDYPKIFAALQLAESALARPVNPTVMTPEAWQEKRAQPDGFVSRVLDGAHIMVLGTEDEL